MKQSRATSFLKSIVSTAVGFAISFAAQLIFLPMLGVPINLTQNTAFAIIMTAISIGRGYLMERAFEAMGWRIRMSAFALAVLAERQRQIASEGWTVEHDDEHRPGELGLAGAAYCISARTQARGLAPSTIEPPECWPWSREWWKPTGFRRDLVKAAALVLAEGEKFDRDRRRKLPVESQSRKAAA